MYAFGPARLVVMAGLPGTGKTTIAGGIARHFRMTLLELDRLEAPLFAQGISGDAIGWSAYAALTALADRNLELGMGVVLDSVAWTDQIRIGWRDLARRHDVDFRPIEVICSDDVIHRSRVEARTSKPIGWQRVIDARRLYEPWGTSRLILDSTRPGADLISKAIKYIETGDPNT